MFITPSSSFNINVYPPCLASQRNTKYKKIVRMQLEQRRPPLILNPSRFNEIYGLWKKGQKENKKFLKERNLREFPKYANNLENIYQNVPSTIYTDTPSMKVYDRILHIKTRAEKTYRIHYDFWLPSPSSLDVNVFDEKAITYFTNFAHIGATGNSSGADHAITLQNGFNLQHNSESINKIYNKLCSRLLTPETDLYRVDYTRYGINCRYISAFVDYKDPSQLIYLFHSWQTNYFCPEQKDLEVLASIKGANVLSDEPFLDGWGRPVTLFCKTAKNLSREERAFVERRNLITEKDFRLIHPGAQEEYGNWRIKNKDILLANAADWRKALPPRESGKEYGFYDVPESHCRYNPNNYPYDLFGPATVIERPVSTLPYGDFYGIK